MAVRCNFEGPEIESEFVDRLGICWCFSCGEAWQIEMVWSFGAKMRGWLGDELQRFGC